MFTKAKLAPIKSVEELKAEAYIKLDSFIQSTNHKISEENINKAKLLIEDFLNKENIKKFKLVGCEVRDGYMNIYDGYAGDIDLVFAPQELKNLNPQVSDEEEEIMEYFEINTKFKQHPDFQHLDDNWNTFFVSVGYTNSFNKEQWDEINIEIRKQYSKQTKKTRVILAFKNLIKEIRS